MAAVISDFFTVTGLEAVPPETLAELIPYLIQVVIAVALVSGVFATIGKLGEVIINWKRW